MTVDREQIRRDLAIHETAPSLALSDTIARHCLALLAELEQAEKERDEYDRDRARWCDTANEAEARLAKVPALVEAASNAKSWIENYPLNANHEADWIALTEELGAALAEWERE